MRGTPYVVGAIAVLVLAAIAVTVEPRAAGTGAGSGTPVARAPVEAAPGVGAGSASASGSASGSGSGTSADAKVGAEDQPVYPPPRERWMRVRPLPYEMTVDVAKRAHRFLGWGLGLHPSDVRHRAVLAELEVDFVRMEVGPSWNHLRTKIPAGVDDLALDAYVARSFDGDSPERLSGARWAFKVLRELEAEVVLVNFELPWHWLEKGYWRRLREDRVRSWARFVVAQLLYLKRRGMYPKYLELANEPDGNWNGQILPDRYRRLVRIARRELDRRGLGYVRLLGPGLAFLRRENVAGIWVNALGREAARDLWGWSTHAWDEVDYRQARPEFLRGCWRPLLDAIAPHGPKPILVTEYATECTRYRGVDYRSPRENAPTCVADRPEFAARVIANSMVHVNRGAGGLIVYRLADHDWDDTTWGIFRRDGSARPLLEAMRAVCPHVPDGAETLEPTWIVGDDPLRMAGFVSADRVVLVLANAGDGRACRRLVLRNLPAVAEVVAHAFVDGARTTTRPRLTDGGLAVDLPAHSTLTVVLRVKEESR